MTATTATGTGPESWGSFEHYAQLVRALMPRATSFAIFDPQGELRWCSETEIGPDVLHSLAEELEAARAGTSSTGTLLSLGGNQPLYLFWLRDHSGQFIAAVGILCRAGNGSAPQGAEGAPDRSFSFASALLKPALECLRRDLVARAEIRRLNHTVDSLDQDLELLLADGARAAPGGNGSDELNGILQQLVEHLRGAFAALIVPEKSIALLRSASTRAPDAQLVARAHRQLLAMAQLRREPIVINGVAGATGNGAAAPGTLPCRVLCCSLRAGAGRSIGVLSLFRDLSDEPFTERDARLADVLARKAVSLVESSYDALSGLFTRQAFEQRLRTVTADKAGPREWCALYVDVDQLHVINDNFGMHVGDGVLAQLGQLIRERLPRGGFGSRISGDRFAVLLPTELDSAERFAEALRAGAENLGAGQQAEARVHVSISIGTARVDAEQGELTHSLAAAETACKAAKERGRNRVEVYQNTDLSLVRRFDDINIAGQVREAIDAGRLRLDAQLILPFAGAESARPHYELLLRMIDAEGRTLAPDRFLSAANRYQLMPVIDRWVIDKAIELLKPHAPLLANKALSFAINFSGQSFNNAEFPDWLVERVGNCGLDPDLFCFELTESATISSMARAEELMRRLRALGCGVALDDFGTGLSSLSYLRQLPVTMLKIDGSFVRDVLKDPRAESMVRAMAQLARTMSIVTVAEYVETEEIRNRVATLGVDYGQGFSIGRPIPLTDLLTELPLLVAASATHPTLEVPVLHPEFVH